MEEEQGNNHATMQQASRRSNHGGGAGQQPECRHATRQGNAHTCLIMACACHYQADGSVI